MRTISPRKHICQLVVKKKLQDKQPNKKGPNLSGGVFVCHIEVLHDIASYTVNVSLVL